MDGREIKIVGNVTKLLQKLSKISNSISKIPKNGRNETYGYSYVTERDVVETLRALLHEEGVALIPNVVSSTDREVLTKGGVNTFITKICMSFTFIDTETGGYLTTYFEGEGEDALDKGIYKAITGCQKYALLKTFLIPTGDDPENEKGLTNGNLDKQNSNIPFEDNPFADEYYTPEPEDYFQNKNNGGNPRKANSNINGNVRVTSQKARQIYDMMEDKNKLISILKKHGYNTSFEILVKDVSKIENEIKRATA